MGFDNLVNCTPYFELVGLVLCGMAMIASCLDSLLNRRASSLKAFVLEWVGVAVILVGHQFAETINNPALAWYLVFFSVIVSAVLFDVVREVIKINNKLDGVVFPKTNTLGVSKSTIAAEEKCANRQELKFYSLSMEQLVLLLQDKKFYNKYIANNNSAELQIHNLEMEVWSLNKRFLRATIGNSHNYMYCFDTKHNMFGEKGDIDSLASALATTLIEKLEDGSASKERLISQDVAIIHWGTSSHVAAPLYEQLEASLREHCAHWINSTGEQEIFSKQGEQVEELTKFISLALKCNLESLIQNTLASIVGKAVAKVGV